MKKSEKYIYLILGVILGGIIAGGILFATTNRKKENAPKTNKTEQKENQDKDQVAVSDGVKLKEVKNVGDKILQTFALTLNGKTKDFSIIYSYEYNKETCRDLISGELNGIIFYEHSSIPSVGAGNACELDIPKKEDIFTIEKVKEYFSLKQFEIIKGKDNKNYLIVYNIVDTPLLNNKAYIFSEDLELISKNTINDSYTDKNSKSYFTLDYRASGSNIKYGYSTNYFLDKNGNSWFNESSCSGTDCEVTFKVVDNKIYYLYLIITVERNPLEAKPDSYGYVEERVYTINNNKLEYEVLNHYNVLDYAY